MKSLEAIILSTLVMGSLYVLISIGLALVWGSLRIFNFAHGVLLMLGAYLTWTFVASDGFGLGFYVGVPLALVAMLVVGVLLELVLVAPLVKQRNAELLAIITTLSGALFLQNLAQIVWGPRLKQLPPIVAGTYSFLGLQIDGTRLLTVIVTPVVLLGLWYVLKRTRIGLAMRGVEQNLSSSLLVGVNVRFVYAFTFAVAAVLAGFAGIVMGTIMFIEPDMGSSPLLKAFIIIILGGLGSLGGTVAAAYLVALLEVVCMIYIGLYWTPAVLFGVMVLVLVLRPSGLFGLKEA